MPADVEVLSAAGKSKLARRCRVGYVELSAASLRAWMLGRLVVPNTEVHVVEARRIVTLCVLSAAFLAAPARADLPPPDDYIETCTRAEQEQDDEYCELYSGGHADPYGCISSDDNAPADEEACESAQSPDALDCCAGWIAEGMSYRCRTWGGSFWSAMWCRERQSGDAPRPAKPEESADDDGCSLTTVSPRAPAAAGLVLLLVAGAAAVRRSRRRRG